MEPAARGAAIRDPRLAVDVDALLAGVLLVDPDRDVDAPAVAAILDRRARRIDGRHQLVGIDQPALDEQRDESVDQRVAVVDARRLLGQLAVREQVPALDLPPSSWRAPAQPLRA